MLLLALIMILQNVLILARKRWRKSKILPLLEQESSGPFATTAVGERGFVVPKVSPTPHNPFPSSPCHSPTTFPPCLLPPAYRSSFSSCQVVYHPSAPSVPARPPVEARKFVQAKQSREILSAFHLVEVSRGASGWGFKTILFAGARLRYKNYWRAKARKEKDQQAEVSGNSDRDFG